MKTTSFFPINENDSEQEASDSKLETQSSDKFQKLIVNESLDSLTSSTKTIKTCENLTMEIKDHSKMLKKTELELCKYDSTPPAITSFEPTEEAINTMRIQPTHIRNYSRDKAFYNQDVTKQEQLLKQDSNTGSKQHDKSLFVLRNNDLYFESFDFKRK